MSEGGFWKMVDKIEGNKHKKEHEWCRCGNRRIFHMHYTLVRPRWVFGEVPPHKFERESDTMRVIEFEKCEKKSMKEAANRYGWNEP